VDQSSVNRTKVQLNGSRYGDPPSCDVTARAEGSPIVKAIGDGVPVVPTLGEPLFDAFGLRVEGSPIARPIGDQVPGGYLFRLFI
jgi:hypothetical protein